MKRPQLPKYKYTTPPHSPDTNAQMFRAEGGKLECLRGRRRCQVPRCSGCLSKYPLMPS